MPMDLRWLAVFGWAVGTNLLAACTVVDCCSWLHSQKFRKSNYLTKSQPHLFVCCPECRPKVNLSAVAGSTALNVI